jgi:hypothetical protein
MKFNFATNIHPSLKFCTRKKNNTATPINWWGVGKDHEVEGVQKQNDRKSAVITIVSFGKPALEQEILELKALVKSLLFRIQELIGTNATGMGPMQPLWMKKNNDPLQILALSMSLR